MGSVSSINEMVRFNNLTREKQQEEIRDRTVEIMEKIQEMPYITQLGLYGILDVLKDKIDFYIPDTTSFTGWMKVIFAMFCIIDPTHQPQLMIHENEYRKDKKRYPYGADSYKALWKIPVASIVQSALKARGADIKNKEASKYYNEEVKPQFQKLSKSIQTLLKMLIKNEEE